MALTSVQMSTLPVEVTRFVGRRRELSDAKRLFSLTHLVTLTGVGGVGKTRIAIRLAHELRREFPDGVFFVPLAELREPELLSHAVTETLGLREQSRETGLDTLVRHIAGKRLLLLLDNCEHQLDACAELLGGLLAACPELRVLTTSREPLLLAGESTLSIPPMSVPGAEPPALATLTQYDAINLFLDRAASAVTGFRLTQDNHLAVATLCHALDGLPLALELAAVRLRTLSIDQILSRLTDRYNLLTGGSRNAPARQQTLRSLITWSHDLCPPDAQLLWARLAVFSGGIELDAAEGVCADDRLPRQSILGLLASLVEKSILIREEHDGHMRYRLLETIRQYGVERLTEAGESAAWRARHRDFYAVTIADIFANWVGAGQAASVSRLRRDHANIRAALDFCVTTPGEATAGLQMASGLYYYWITRGFLSEGRHWLDELLAVHEDRDGHRIKALYVAASLAVLQGASTEASELLDKAFAIAQGLDDEPRLSYVAQARALAALFADDQFTAITLFEESLRFFEGTDDRSGEYFTLVLLGLARVFVGDHRGFAEVLQRCRDLTLPTGESWGWSYTLWVAGLDAWQRGENEEATGYITESMRIKRTFDDRLGLAECIEAMACVASSAGRQERAATLLGAAEAIWQKLGISLTNFPGLARYREQCVRAARRLGQRPYQSAYQRGARLSSDDAVRYALGESIGGGAATAAGYPVRLTPREREVARLVSRGMTNQEIATELGVSRRTVEAHVEHVLAKLGFTSRTQIAAWITEHGDAGAPRPSD